MNTPNPLELNNIMQNSQEVVCSNCGGKFFKQVVMLRKVSQIISPSGAPELLPIVVFRCDDCGMPLEDMVPKEEPPTPKLISE